MGRKTCQLIASLPSRRLRKNFAADQQGCTRIRPDVRRLVHEPGPSAPKDLVIRGLSACIPADLRQNSYGTRGQTPAIENGTAGLAFFSTEDVGEHCDHGEEMVRAGRGDMTVTTASAGGCQWLWQDVTLPP